MTISSISRRSSLCIKLLHLNFFSLLSCRSSIISQSHSKFLKDQHVWVQLSLLRSSVCLWTHTGEGKHMITNLHTVFFCLLFSLLQTQLILLHPLLLSAAPFRSELSLQPITEDDADNQGEQFECSEGFSYEDVSNQQPETRLQQTCRRRGDEGGVLIVNIVPVKDAVTFKHTGGVGENFDVPFVLHLWPTILLRNLLPYPISYKLKVRCFW